MKFKFDKLLFVISYILILIPFSFIQLNWDQDFLKVLYLVSIVILSFLFFYQIFNKNNKIKRNTLIMLLILFVLSIVSSLCIGNTIMLRTFLFICAFRNIKFDEFIKCDAIIRFLFIIILFVLFSAGLTEPVEAYRGDIFSHSFGFNHPNKFGLYALLVCMDITYLTLKKSSNLKWLSILFVSLLTFIVYYFIGSRAHFLMMVCCLILLIVNKSFIFKIIEIKPIKFLIKNSFLVLTIISFSLIFLYRTDSTIMTKIDIFISNRLYWASEYIDNYGINLFGNDLKLLEERKEIGGNHYFTVDNSYAFATLNYGIVFLIIIIILFRNTFKILYKNKKYLCIIFLFLFIIYGFMESNLVKFYHNPFLLLFNYTLFKDQEMF